MRTSMRATNAHPNKDDDDDDDDDGDDVGGEEDEAIWRRPGGRASSQRKGRRKSSRHELVASGDDDHVELEAAFRLFTGGGPGPITVAHLKRVARQLQPRSSITDPITANTTTTTTAAGATTRNGRGRNTKNNRDQFADFDGADAADDDMLHRMILEANGNAGIGRGVSFDDFRDVMKRAGAF